MNETEKLKAFSKHCLNGDAEEVERQLSSGEIDLSHHFFFNTKNQHYLECAVKSDSIDVVRILLNYGAKLSTGIPLHLACQKGNLAIVETLINAGAKVNKYYTRFHTPLFHAVKHKHVNIVQLLLDRGADDEDLERVCVSSFSGSTDVRSRDTIRLLLDNNIIELETLFNGAVFSRKQALIRFLIDEGANVNFRSETGNTFPGMTPLCAACSFTKEDTNRSREVVELLLSNGADPNMPCINYNWPGLTPLMMDPDVSIVEILLKHGADINGRDSKGNTALHHCRDREAMAFLISHGIDTSVKNSDNKTVREVLEDNLDHYADLLEHYDATMEEFSKLKQTILNTYGLNLHDILLIDRHELTQYVNNVNLKMIVEDPEFLMNFPIFGKKLEEKFELAKERRKLMSAAAKFLENRSGKKIPELLHFMLFKYLSDSEIKSVVLADLIK